MDSEEHKYIRRPSSSRGILASILGVGLVVTALGFRADAVADVAGTLWPAYRANFGSLQDPEVFLDEMDVLFPVSAVPLTQEDAVAHELGRRARTLTPAEVQQVAHTLCEEADELGHDPMLFLAVIRIESNFNHLAISPVGAEGLMQLMPYTAEWFAPMQQLQWDGHSFDPVLNVQLGSRYLAMLDKEFHGRMDLALTAYNRGPRATKYIVNKYGRLPTDIRDFYATKVLDKYQDLKNRYGHLRKG